MSDSLRSAPDWLINSLQGLAFWVGHRCSIYSAHELSEGALAAELCNLLHAHLPDNYRLRCEEPYKKFVPNDIAIDGIGARARVDLSVWERYRLSGENKYRQRPLYAIELKRANAPKSLIDQDLKRLAGIVQESDGIRAILCIASEGKRPKRFTTLNGTRKSGVTPIPDTQCVYQVISVRKASHVYGNRDVGHYSCAIEVFLDDV